MSVEVCTQHAQDVLCNIIKMLSCRFFIVNASPFALNLANFILMVESQMQNLIHSLKMTVFVVDGDQECFVS